MHRLRNASDDRPAGRRLATLLSVVMLAFGGCTGTEQEAAPVAPAPEPEPTPVTLDASVLDDPARPAEERAQDAGRKPIDVYEFFGIEPGHSVADVYNSDGYNTHLLSRLVGDTGKVYSVFEFYGNREFMDGILYKVDVLTERVEAAGLRNVELAMHLSDVPSESVDVAIAIRNYHDVEWVFPELKRASQVAEFFRIVKPGGIVGIVEVATPNEGWDAAAHRLGKQVVIDDFVGGGFELAGESDLLANPADDHTIDGFPDRFTTDRYTLKFRKPAS